MKPALSLLSSRVAKTTRDLSYGDQLHRFGSITLNIENTTYWEVVGWTASPMGIRVSVSGERESIGDCHG